MTRKEKQAHTRACLLESAARVFARRGMQQASIDEVAEDAGYTKGAFYANFKNKEELFLAMLDQRFAEHLERLDEVIAPDEEISGQARQAGLEFMRHIAADPEWERLFFEFAAYAARNEDFRQELVTRYRSLCDRIAEMFRQRVEAFDVDPPIPVDDIATMTFMMANGVAMEKMLDPDRVPDDMYGTMLMVFFAGLIALAEKGGGPAEAGAPRATLG
jgi:AcrR family transcriptional regulator